MSVRVVSVGRDQEAFQQPLTDEQLESVCERAFGAGVVDSAVELGVGTYNTTYRLETAGQRSVLRVAPQAGRAGESPYGGLRNEYAAAPFFAGLGELTPRIMAADFTGELVNRDYLVQSFLPGVPAPELMDSYPRPDWAHFYRQLGRITRRIHQVCGPGFGPVADARHATWSEALISELLDSAGEYEAAALDPDQVREIADFVAASRAIFDVVEPRLLHGDLWHLNILLAPDAAVPTITGICDSDRANWGDPLADWTIEKARQRPGTERDAFWDTYGKLSSDPASRQRLLVYRARTFIGSRLDIHRRGLRIEEIPPEHWELAPVLTALA